MAKKQTPISCPKCGFTKTEPIVREEMPEAKKKDDLLHACCRRLASGFTRTCPRCAHAWNENESEAM